MIIKIGNNPNWKEVNMKRVTKGSQFYAIFVFLLGILIFSGFHKERIVYAKDGDYADEEYVILSKTSGKVMDVPDGSQDDVQVIINEFNYSNNQIFHFIKLKDGSYLIVANHSGKVLTVKEGNKSEGAIIQATRKNSKSQKWKLIKQSDGSVMIQSVLSKQYLDVSGYGIYDGEGMIQRKTSQSQTMKWLIKNRQTYLGGTISAKFKTIKTDICTYATAVKGQQTMADGHIYNTLTKGIKEVGGNLYFSHAIRTKSYLEPLFWGTQNSTGNDKNSLPGTLPTVGWAGEYGKGKVVVFAGHELFFAKNADGHFDNDEYRINLLNWLLKNKKQLAFSNGHGEVITASKFSPVLTQWAEKMGVSIDEDSDIEELLKHNIGLLIIGNASRKFTDQELILIERFVRNGGSLCVLGLGWSWSSYKNDLHCDYAPMNQFGQIFGWKACEGILKDPDAPNQNTSQPSFLIKPYDNYQPKKVSILEVEGETNESLKRKFAQNPENIFVLEGKNTGFHVRTEDWLKCEQPKLLLDLLDQVYDQQMQLIGRANQPYKGEKIWYISVKDEKGSYYMHAGNPIVMKQEAGLDVIESMNKEQYLGWGVPHEMGHDFMNTACNDLMTCPGTEEPWANVFNVWAHDKLGWTYGIHKDIYQEGREYLLAQNKSIDTFRNSDWIFLGCLNQLWKDYGQEGTKKALTIAAQDAKAGRSFISEEEKAEYLMLTFSKGYQRDLSAYFKAWGFEIDAELKKKLENIKP